MMKITSFLLCIALLLIAPFLSAATDDTAAKLTGSWRGIIDPDDASIELIFHIHSSTDDGWRGTVDTPAQNSFGLPLSGISIDEDGRVMISVAASGAVFEAKLTSKGDELQGTWKQRGAELTLHCQRIDKLPAMPAEIAMALSGSWEGVLPVGTVQLRIHLHLERTEDNSFSGFMVSPDQSPTRLSVTRVDFLQDRRVRICVGEASVRFEMDLSGSGDELQGSFLQGRSKFDMSLTRVEQLRELRRPQQPKPPFPYRSEDVTYVNPAAGITFAGTLTIPQGQGPFPCALLITGSGSQDRDEMIFEHRPFLIIADHLTRKGIAVLRVDDRGVGKSTSGIEPGKATTEDFVGDVLSGFKYLKEHPEIDGSKIGLIGHSEGGVIAPLAAVKNPEIAFIVLMAGTGIRGDLLLVKQNELISRASGVEQQVIDRGLKLSRQLFAVLREDDISKEVTRSKIEELVRKSPDLPGGEAGDGEVARVIAELEIPWIRWFVRHDPAPILEKVRCPVLAINGSLDLQVPCKDNLAAIESALKRGRNPDYEVVEFPDLNHLFQHCKTGLPSEYGEIEESFSVEVLEKMTQWVLHRFGKKN
ncbi:MAG: alpha/beta fold hydrolase [Planctomycetota bacterium]|nr:alpha/beta fold hydrolase [Planctomycetota bacterium]